MCPEDNMNTEPGRACPFCAETIKANAKVCPRCRQWLTLRSLRNPVVSICVTGLPMLACIVGIGLMVFTKFDRIWNPKPDYTEFLDSVRVVESRINWVASTNGYRMYLVGLMTNQSQVAWRDIELECRFFDTNGVMVDVSSARCNLTIQPNDEAAFRAIINPGRPTNDYALHKLTVSSARNTRGLF
jgi:hypothetical protein